MNVKGFKQTTTGGNCSALIHEWDNKEVLLTDGNMAAPDSFPCEASYWLNGEYEDSVVIASEKELTDWIESL